MIEQFENKIINADCLDILKQLPDKCIDLVLTDPPYGINANKNPISTAKKYHSENDMNKDWDNERPSVQIFKEILRVSKNQIIWGGKLFC